MKLPRIAITMGDPAGIGPELCLRMLQDRAICAQCVPLVLGDLGILERVAGQLDLPLPDTRISLADWRDGSSQTVERAGIVDVGALDADRVQPGKVDAATGRASYRYIEESIAAALSGRVDAVSTGPVHKEALHAAGVPYPGHTEIFAAKTNAERACMMLTCEQITCSFVTTHVGYRNVPGLLSVARIREVLELSHEALLRLRGRTPRMVVCGLNPHAGEQGLFGEREEERFIIPACEAARAAGMEIVGPLPPDTAFLPWRRAETDCFVCMYHDQGHIPLKALAFDVAVNVTLGLPIIRTSVDHGTALDIAWQNKADLTSMSEAVTLAARLASGRQQPLAASR